MQRNETSALKYLRSDSFTSVSSCLFSLLPLAKNSGVNSRSFTTGPNISFTIGAVFFFTGKTIFGLGLCVIAAFCVAMLCDKSRALILAADKMLGIGYIETEPEITKILDLHKNWKVLFAGDDITPVS